MDEENKLDFQYLQDIFMNASQGSDIITTETFEEIWQSAGTDLINDFKLDSSVNNENNQQDTTPVENAVHGLQNLAMIPSVQLPTQISTIDSNVYQGSSSLPASETWPGVYDFTVSFSLQPKSTKGVSWTYSRMKDKLYVGKDVPCPVNFSANTQLPKDTFIRVMAAFTSPEQVTEVVQRCINHSMEDLKKGSVEARHLIRCESSTATYHVDAVTGHHSVRVPFENPPAGQQYSTYIYKFACFGSCSGGPNRRPLMLIFTLERGNQVIGRKKLDVKICACPGRDRKTDEAQCLALDQGSQHTVLPVKRKQTSENMILSDVMAFTQKICLPLPKKSKVTPNKDGLYVLNTEDIECYQFLKQMKKFFEICKTMKGVTPDVLSKVLRQAQKVKNEKSD